MTAKEKSPAWEKLTPDEKLESRCRAWLEARGIDFATPEAEAGYKGRVSRILDAILMDKKPDRVPVTPFLGEYAAAYCGYTQRDVMYDAGIAIEVANRCTLEFDFDAKTPAASPVGRVWEILGEKQRRWPGHGVANGGSMQFVEGEYMLPDEYDDFNLDEADFRWRNYLPRIWEAAEPLTKLMSLDSVNAGSIGRLGLPEVRESLERLMQAGEEANRWTGKIAEANRQLTRLGYPDFRGRGLGIAPFDAIGDNLRGQKGISLDMYQRPEELLRAIDMITEKRLLQIRRTGPPEDGVSPIVGFPLHKGADGFMSDSQFRTFYWPSLRKICLALIEHGFIPELRTQGGYESRLEVIRDLPRGRAFVHLYLTDVQPAKKALGDVLCIVGAVPQSLLSVGTPEDVETYARRLIDIGGEGGGFMLSSPGALGAESNAENIRAMIRTAKEYGVYR